jgi:hypothetical protein
MMGQWLDLTGVRYKIESQRNALNLIQLIVSTSPLVYRDPNLEPNKLILDAYKLDDYNNFDMYDQGNFGNSRYKNWNKCCVFPEYDYEMDVFDNVSGSKWHINPVPKFKTDKESKCYSKRVTSYADLPVVIRKKNNEKYEYHPGFINITMTKTPLSDLSSWLSQAFTRASWDEYKNIFPATDSEGNPQPFEITVRLDPEIKDVSVDNSGIVCLTFRDGTPPPTYCKSFQKTTVTLQASAIQNQIETSCYDVRIDIYADKVEVK